MCEMSENLNEAKATYLHDFPYYLHAPENYNVHKCRETVLFTHTHVQKLRFTKARYLLCSKQSSKSNCKTTARYATISKVGLQCV